MTASRVGYVYDSGLADYIPFTGPPASLPSGMVTMTAANTAPSGWLLCNGSAISRTTYADLFTAIGTTYGVGDGSTTFNIPDLRGRVAVGTDSSQTEFDVLGETGGSKTQTLTTAQLPLHSHSTPALSGTFTSGNPSANHTHSGSTTSDSHYHSTNTAGDASSYLSGSTVNMRYTDTGSPTLNTSSDSHAHSFTTGGVSAWHTHNTTVSFDANTSGDTGSGEGHNNLQPYVVLNYIIKY